MSMWIFHFPSEHSQVTDVVTFESGAICEEQMTFKPGGAEVLCCSASQQIPPPQKRKRHLTCVQCILLVSDCTFLDRDPLRFGRPGVECYCQHETGAAVIQLQFLINEVG